MTFDEHGHSTAWNRRQLLNAAVASGGLLASAASAQGVSASTAPTDWPLVFDLTVRFPQGRLADWNQFWGEENVPLLESKGQWLWGAWSSLTGQLNTVCHQWAYKDFAHYQAMADMRATDARVLELAKRNVPIEQVVNASIMSRLPYHPAVPAKPRNEAGLIVTHRIYTGNGARLAEHIRLTRELTGLMNRYDAQLIGAFQTFFGWWPTYILQVWRYTSVEQYWKVRRDLDTDAAGQQLLKELRAINPHEVVELQRPMQYSRTV